MTALPKPAAALWPEAVVFDLDGTLADTAFSIQMALNSALDSEGFPSLDVDTVKTMIGAGPEKLVQRALTALSVDFGPKMTRRITDEFHRAYRRQGNMLSALFFGVETCLARLATSGVRMGVCSNKPDAFCAGLLADLGVLEYITAIQGSGAGLPHKPDPRPLLATLNKLGVAPDRALYVGDSETDVLTARAADVEVAVVSYGYTTTPAAQLGADWVLGTLFDLPDLRRAAAPHPRQSIAI